MIDVILVFVDWYFSIQDDKNINCKEMVKMWRKMLILHRKNQ